MEPPEPEVELAERLPERLMEPLRLARLAVIEIEPPLPVGPELAERVPEEREIEPANREMEPPLERAETLRALPLEIEMEEDG